MQLSRTKFRKSFSLSTKKWIKCFPGKNPGNLRGKSGDIRRAWGSHFGDIARLVPKDTLAIVLQTRLKGEVLVAFETLVTHDFPHKLLNVSHPHGKVLVPFPAAHMHVKALDEPLLDGIGDPLVKICIMSAGSKSGRFKRAMTSFSSSTVHQTPPELLISGVKQGYYQINWDDSGYPTLLVVTCGPERVGTGATPTG